MDLEQQIIYGNKNYKILDVEQEFIVHPVAFGMLPLSKASLQNSFSSNFHLEGYRLMLDKLTLSCEDMGNASILKTEGSRKEYIFQDCTVRYSGAILIGETLVKDYFVKNGNLTHYSYQNVFELVFEKGLLITTVDQSKAMLKIRKNIDLGLRSLNRSRDLRCIKRFMNSSLVGDYKDYVMSINRMRYVKDMVEDYIDFDYINNY